MFVLYRGIHGMHYLSAGNKPTPAVGRAIPPGRNTTKPGKKRKPLKERVIAYLEQVVGGKGFTIHNAGMIDTSAGSAQAWAMHTCTKPVEVAVAHCLENRPDADTTRVT